MNRIKEILSDHGITQEELALRVGLSQSEISRIANEKRKDLTLRNASKIAKALGKPVEYVFPDY